MDRQVWGKLLIALTAFFSAFLLLTLPSPVRGGEILDVSFAPDPVFNQSSFWPGDAIPGLMIIKNKSALSQGIFIRTANVLDPANLGEVLNLEIREGATPLYSDLLSHLFLASGVQFSELSPGEVKEYDLEILFLPEAGNQYQAKGLSFDLMIGSIEVPEGEEEEEEEPGEGEGEGEGEVTFAILTGGPGPEELVISQVRAGDIKQEEVTITWQTNTASTSQVIYSPDLESHSLTLSLPPFYGYAAVSPEPEDTHLVTSHKIVLFDLISCQSYYYRVISHLPYPPFTPVFSSEHNFATLCKELPQKEEEGEVAEQEVREEAGEVGPGLPLSEEEEEGGEAEQEREEGALRQEGEEEQDEGEETGGQTKEGEQGKGGPGAVLGEEAEPGPEQEEGEGAGGLLSLPLRRFANFWLASLGALFDLPLMLFWLIIGLILILIILLVWRFLLKGRYEEFLKERRLRQTQKQLGL